MTSDGGDPGHMTGDPGHMTSDANHMTSGGCGEEESGSHKALLGAILADAAAGEGGCVACGSEGGGASCGGEGDQGKGKKRKREWVGRQQLKKKKVSYSCAITIHVHDLTVSFQLQNSRTFPRGKSPSWRRYVHTHACTHA